MSLAEATSLASSPLPPLSRAVVSFALTVATWELRLRTRKHLQNLPPHVQAELSQLLGLLCTAPGRFGLAGLVPAWADASEAQLQAALEGMRQSGLALRQQAYLGLHEIVGGAYFSDESTWASVGYPGPPIL